MLGPLDRSCSPHHHQPRARSPRKYVRSRDRHDMIREAQSVLREPCSQAAGRYTQRDKPRFTSPDSCGRARRRHPRRPPHHPAATRALSLHHPTYVSSSSKPPRGLHTAVSRSACRAAAAALPTACRQASPCAPLSADLPLERAPRHVLAACGASLGQAAKRLALGARPPRAQR
jgi:hypothetical protein